MGHLTKVSIAILSAILAFAATQCAVLAQTASPTPSPRIAKVETPSPSPIPAPKVTAVTGHLELDQIIQVEIDHLAEWAANAEFENLRPSVPVDDIRRALSAPAS